MDKICMSYCVNGGKYAIVGNYSLDYFTLVKISGSSPYLNNLNQFNKHYDINILYRIIKRTLKGESLSAIDYDLDFVEYLENAIFEIAEDDLSLALELSSFFFHDIYDFMKEKCLKASKW